MIMKNSKLTKTFVALVAIADQVIDAVVEQVALP